MVKPNKYEDMCIVCQALGHTMQDNGCTLLMLTLSPCPQWKNYGELDPDQQKLMLHEVVHDKHIKKKLKKYFQIYEVISEHYEFTKGGQVHSHCLISIPDTFHGFKRNEIFISKQYHRLVGQQYCRSTIAAHVEFVNDIGVYGYVNKENAYDPWHCTRQPTIVELFNNL